MEPPTEKICNHPPFSPPLNWAVSHVSASRQAAVRRSRYALSPTATKGARMSAIRNDYREHTPYEIASDPESFAETYAELCGLGLRAPRDMDS